MKTVFLFFTLMSTAASAESKVWQEKMRAVSQAMAEVVPYLYPTPSKDSKGLLEKVTKLHDLTEDLDIKNDHMTKVKDFDPGLISMAGEFKTDIDRAYLALKEGHADYARYVLRDSTSYCIGCHTRTSQGPQFPLRAAFVKALKDAPWIARMEFLAASRQFDEVYAETIDELKKKKSSLGSLDLDRGVRLSLSIAIRVKNDPKMALRLADAVLASKSSVQPMRLAAQDWRKAILQWQKEKPKKHDSAAQLLAEASAQINKAKTSGSKGNDDVNYLRATTLLHELLIKFPQSSEVPDALYLIGESYTPLQELGLWTLQEKYFQACINQAPHTKLAEKCYQRLEESIAFGYSGSSGTHIPLDIQRHLKAFKDKAQKN